MKPNLLFGAARNCLVACVLATASASHGQIPGLEPSTSETAAKSTARDRRVLNLDSGGVLRYAIVLPDNFHASKPVPVLLALPPGAQDEKMVEAGLRMYWEREARARGWVVVSPEAPDGKPFTGTGSDGFLAAVPALLDDLSKSITIEGNRVHLAGVSNGGRAAFRLAVSIPDRFASLTVLPGSPSDPEDFSKLDRLKGIPVSMFVGEMDRSWVRDSDKTAARLRDLGVVTNFEVLSGQSHVIEIEPRKLFDLFEKARPRTTRSDRSPRPAITEPSKEESSVIAVLTDFHDAAAKADETRYFSHLAPGAVFLGTDATERWTKEEFLAWARSRGLLRDGKGWMYTATDRWITIHPSGDLAWFDELLDNAKYGECRGSGVLVKTDGRWVIAQYNLSKPVPNDLMLKLVDLIRDMKNTTHEETKDINGVGGSK